MLDVEWIHTEFSKVDFGDSRLDSRFHKVINRMAEKPQQTICRASEDWSEAKGTYRMFSNESVTPSRIMEPHTQMTLERCTGRDIVLAIQDTVYISYNHRPKTSGLGPISVTKYLTDVNGLLMHTAFAVASDGEPLGILAQNIWSRERKPKPNGNQKKKLDLKIAI